jgi:phage shock protein PspC (stress-responsive transcriptional regulator)
MIGCVGFRSLFWTRCCLDQNCTDTISFAGFGTGILAYIILWIVALEAITTSEKLEMTGEPVTISNIERKVREFENVSDKLKTLITINTGKTGAGRLGNSFGDFVNVVCFFRVILIITGITVLFFLLVGYFTLGSGLFIDFPCRAFYSR